MRGPGLSCQLYADDTQLCIQCSADATSMKVSERLQEISSAMKGSWLKWSPDKTGVRLVRKGKCFEKPAKLPASPSIEGSQPPFAKVV